MDTGEAAGKERWFMCELCFLSEGVGWVGGGWRGGEMREIHCEPLMSPVSGLFGV